MDLLSNIEEKEQATPASAPAQQAMSGASPPEVAAGQQKTPGGSDDDLPSFSDADPPTGGRTQAPQGGKNTSETLTPTGEATGGGATDASITPTGGSAGDPTQNTPMDQTPIAEIKGGSIKEELEAASTGGALT